MTGIQIAVEDYGINRDYRINQELSEGFSSPKGDAQN